MREFLIMNIVLLTLLFVVVSMIFGFCLKNSKESKVQYTAPQVKQKPNFICRISLRDFDYRKTTITDFICDIFMLPTKVRVNWNSYKGCFEIDNYPYEVVTNNDYLYIYKRELI